MYNSTQQFVDVLRERGIRFTEKGRLESGSEVIELRYTGKNISTIVATFFFDSDEKGVAVRVFDLVKVPEGKEDSMLRAINGQNNRFRFSKFCLNTKDNTIQMEMDGIFRRYDVGEICREMLVRAIQICDEAYPEFMKAMWT